MAPPQALWNHRQTASTANETEGWALDGCTDGVLARTRWPGCESTNLRIFLKRFRDRSSYPGYISRVLEFRSQDVSVKSGGNQVKSGKVGHRCVSVQSGFLAVSQAAFRNLDQASPAH